MDHRDLGLKIAAPLAALTLIAASAAQALPAAAVSAHPLADAARQHSVGSTYGVLFDDFDYRSATDPQVGRHGWTVHGGVGGPGVEDGATWQPSDISFPKIKGGQALRLTMTTDGTAAGTTESEFARSSENSLAGTYVARIKFADTPARGRDGDHLVQSFFAISTTPDCDPSYSETDFSEYLPNGGYGSSDPVNSQTTWRSTGDNCSDSVETDESTSVAGWHTVMSTVANGHVKYYIDGKLVADHSGRYYPRRSMAVDFNLWLIDLSGHQGTSTSVWHEDVDYVLYAKNLVLTQRQVADGVAFLRRLHVAFVDTL